LLSVAFDGSQHTERDVARLHVCAPRLVQLEILQSSEV